MKTFNICLIILFFALTVGAKRVSILPDLTNPSDLKLDEGHIYIVDGSKILVYSRTDYKLLKKLGKGGDEPGAFRPYFGGQHRLYVDVQADEILVTSNEKLSVFSKSFIFRQDHKLPAQIGYCCKAGNNLVASNYYWEKNPATTEKIIIFKRNKKDYNYVKEFYKTGRGGGRLRGLNPGKKNNYPVISHTFDHHIWKKQVFIGDTSRGFYIAVFDNQGDQLYEIQKEYIKIPVTEKSRQYEINEFKSKRIWKKYKQLIEPTFPEFYPAFRQFRVADDRIYVFTYKRRGQKEEVLILDLNGNLSAKVMVPLKKYFSVFEGTYYYLNQNENQEWELFIEPIGWENKHESHQ